MADDGGEDLKAFAQKIRDLDEEAFLREHGTPYLLVQEYVREEATTFSTGKVNVAPKRVAGPDPTAPGDSLGRLHPVRKTDRNAFQNMISVGRTTINDIILNHPSISKLHAFFQAAPGGSGSLLTDSESSFGTTLDGVRLAPHKAFPVSSGQKLVFGGAVQALFLTPEGLFEHIRSLRFFRQI